MIDQIEDKDPRHGAPRGVRQSRSSAAERGDRSRVMFREVNERIAELSTQVDGVGMTFFICECGDDGCAESLEVTPAEYEAVRAHADRFVVLAGHQLPGIEHVVDGNERFLVVENTGDAAGPVIAGDSARS